jgi:hypothetical protein
MRWIVFAPLLLAGCAAPQIGAASASGGIVKNYGWKPNASLELAQAHCAKYGKDAVISSENDMQDHMTFVCVRR